MTEPDPRRVAAYWSTCLRDVLGLAERVDADRVPGAWSFGDSPSMADELLALVVDGPKRATAGALAGFELENEPVPVVGDLSILIDGRGEPAALIETTEVRVGPLESVDDAFAFDEGEGDRTRDWWLEAHIRFFQRWLPTIGLSFTEGMATVFERFRLLHVDGRGPVPEPASGRGRDAA